MKKQTLWAQVRSRGFTLIEAMIVVAILAILIILAVPAYQDYTIRAQVAEGMNLVGAAKVGVTETYSNTGAFPGSNSAAGIAAATDISGEYVSQVAVGASGVITATFGSGANDLIENDTLVFTPDATTNGGGAIDWTCSSTTLDPKYLPEACR